MTYLWMQMLLCLLVAFLLGLLVGWWLCRRGREARLESLEEEWRRKLDDCREELEECLKKRRSPEEPASAEPAAAAELSARGSAEAAGAPDDLTKIEGIGPKISGLLEAAGISTWARLAETGVPALQAVLDQAGPRYRIHDPGTWPRQAGLAAAGAWADLESLQDQLKGGRESS